MAVKIRKGSALDAMNLTPLIDVIFQLLLFFMVATRFDEADNAMNVELPSASEAKPLIVQPKEVFININAAGKVFVGGREYQLSQLEDYLDEVARNNPARQSAVIRADKRASWDVVAQVMNSCMKAGVAYTPTTAGSD